jgi:integrase
LTGSSIDVTKMLPGVHRVSKTRADGTLVMFWYAWRGGPQILKVEARSDAALAQAVALRAPAAIAAYEAERRPGSNSKFLDGLITRYLIAMTEDDKLSPRTKSDRRKYLDKVRIDLGDMEIKALESKRARAVLMKWRNRYSKTPKSADERLGALSVVLAWAVDEGELSVNPVESFTRLYKANRAEIIWEAEHLALLLPHAAAELWNAVQLAAHTGLRMGDLIRLPWGAVGEHAIVWQTSKSRGRRTVVIPITVELRKVLDGIPRSKKSLTVLVSARDRPWSLAGLGSAMQRAYVDARDLFRQQANDDKAKGPLDHLRFHDLRGTAVTNFVRNGGLELGDIAQIVGWSRDKVEQIAARYVTAEEIGKAIVERMRRNKASTEAVNAAVNDAETPKEALA